MKPNIFRLATKELSQDSFFTWLLQWADIEHKEYNQQLHETAQDFIKWIIGESSDYVISKVEADRQWRNIDICAKVNEEYFIAIEDKTNTAEHSEQLERYKDLVETHYQNQSIKLIFIYLKTGNESLATLKKVVSKGYSIIDRKGVLDILNARQVENEVFTEFKEYLASIEAQTNSCVKLKDITSDIRAAEGFYMKLQAMMVENTDWRYVPNQAGGFLSFWYYSIRSDDFKLYIQIENAFRNGIKVVVKIRNWDLKTDTLYKILSELQPYAKQYSLTIKKPDRYKVGKTSTLAIVKNAITIDEEGNIDIELLIQTLSKLEKVLDAYCGQKEGLANSNGITATSLIPMDNEVIS